VPTFFSNIISKILKDCCHSAALPHALMTATKVILSGDTCGNGTDLFENEAIRSKAKKKRVVKKATVGSEFYRVLKLVGFLCLYGAQIVIGRSCHLNCNIPPATRNIWNNSQKCIKSSQNVSMVT